LVFLELNGVDTDAIPENDMESLTLLVADGSADKVAATAFFRKYVTQEN